MLQGRVSLSDVGVGEREAEGEIMVLFCKSFVFKCIALLRGPSQYFCKHFGGADTKIGSFLVTVPYFIPQISISSHPHSLILFLFFLDFYLRLLPGRWESELSPSLLQASLSLPQMFSWWRHRPFDLACD